MEQGISRNELIASLSKSSHGKLIDYEPITRRAAKEQPEFLSHLLAWNYLKGQVRDSKVALPTITLSVEGFPEEYRENSLAHLALLDPRNLLRAIRFSKEIRQPASSGKNALNRLVSRYLRTREENWRLWERTAVQHRNTMRELYALCHVKPSEMANVILYRRGLDKGVRDYPKGSIFESISQLKNMTASEAAGTILNRKIPFLIAAGALGKRMKEPDIVLALIERMTPTELVTNTKLLQKLGIKTDPALRSAFEKGLAKAQGSKKNTLKTSRAAEAMEEIDESIAEKLKALQEKQIASVSGIEGNWLVLADKSGSMSQAIDLSRHVSATLARFVKGNVHLVFFDESPRYFNATSKTLEEITNSTKSVTAVGGTSIGCGLSYAIENKFEIDGIAIISDGGENRSPTFADYYRALAASTGKTIPVYFYKCSGEIDRFTLNCSGIDVQTFDLRGSNIDYYSVVNTTQTLRANKYSLADEILATKLLTQDDVFDKIGSKKGELVHAG